MAFEFEESTQFLRLFKIFFFLKNFIFFGFLITW